MSFGDPFALLCLAVVPLAVLAHVAAQRRRRRYPVRFTALATLAAVAGEEPRWRRHLPLALLSLALAALAVSLARPERTVGVPVERATVVLVTDVSRSMSASDVRPTRLQAARRAAQSFVDQVPKAMRIGLVAYSDVSQTLQKPTTDRTAIKAALASLQPYGGTLTGAGLQTALGDLEIAPDESARRPPSAILLLSDGKSDDGTLAYEVATEARRLGVPIYTVALGTPDGAITDVTGRVTRVPPDPAALRRIASLSGGQAFQAEDSDQLGSIYDKLGSQLGTQPEQREMTVVFAGAGLLLLAAALGASLGLGGRLP